MPQRYIKKILDARVYDVAIETPLTEARSLSKRLYLLSIYPWFFLLCYLNTRT